MLEKVRDIIEGASNSYGVDFFNNITLSLDKVINADYTFIAKINKQAYSSQTIALVAKGELLENIDYSLENTPCADAANDSICCYPKNVCAAFPKDQRLVEMKIEGYLATPLHDSHHKIIGLIVALYQQPISNEQEVLTLFQVFSGRIAAELERREYEKLLEQKVDERIQELSNTLKQLKLAQGQLVESEKMAALGGLVAGISHEVNTPLGIAITTQSIMVDELKRLNRQIDSEKLTMKAMNSYRQAVDSALSMQGENLDRAKKLIENFKKTAVDQHQLDIERIDIAQYYQKVASTLKSLLKPKKVSLEISCDDSISLATYPGVHAQIVTNLVTNSVRHGFDKPTGNNVQENKIAIAIKMCPENEVEIRYTDNGKGLTQEAKKHLFEPFFTTAREQGGVGLGMSIILNLINQKLNGSINYLDKDTGACFVYRFKENK